MHMVTPTGNGDFVIADNVVMRTGFLLNCLIPLTDVLCKINIIATLVGLA